MRRLGQERNRGFCNEDLPSKGWPSQNNRNDQELESDQEKTFAAFLPQAAHLEILRRPARSSLATLARRSGRLRMTNEGDVMNDEE
ncbi:MAG TPA: hypothetical protein VN380_06595 [Thermoanaerobaculia bacterium]|jgi:hypothetical protein|nr:hypothetical protein [Thermoanaerobaculia bacterium]